MTVRTPLLETTALTVLALVAFAANSVLCRYALEEQAIDAASFTALRLFSGAVVLAMLVFSRRTSVSQSDAKGSWLAGFMLFSYAACFSFAYLILGAAMGALILFGVVQLTMVALSLRAGHRLHSVEWLGLVLAFSGFVYLLLPGLTAPPLTGLALMVLSGIAWAIYSLQGQQSSHAMMDTAYNFLRTLPFVGLLLLFFISEAHYSLSGIGLAIASGAITSALGYVIWYQALQHLSALQAAVVQLLVPVFTAVGGVLLLSEVLSLRLVVASTFILGGILIVILGRYYFVRLKVNT